MDLIRFVLPYLFLGYFLVKGLKRPIYFLGVPFLIFMNGSVFFGNVTIFNNPGSLGTARIFFWTVVFWTIPILVRLYTKEFTRHRKIEINVIDYCILALTTLTVIGLVSVIINYRGLDDVMVEFLTIISLFIGYFIIKDWASKYDSKIIKQFVFTIIVINTIASVLYILHQGVGFKIYLTEEYSLNYVQGEEITRTFWFMPQFLSLSVAYLLVFKKEKTAISLILLVINIFAIFVTYTRSALINTALIFVLYSVLVGLKKRKAWLVIRDTALYIVGGIAGLIILSHVMPAKSEFLLSRFRELRETSSSPLEMNTLEYRFMMTGMVFSNIEPGNLVQGMGPVTENQEPIVPTMKRVTSDMVWAGVTYRWGFLGLIIFFMLYGFSVVIAYRIFVRSDNTINSDMALVLLLFIISQIIEGFVSWTFMSGHGYVTGLWYFSILSVLIGKNAGIIMKNLKNVNYEG